MKDAVTLVNEVDIMANRGNCSVQVVEEKAATNVIMEGKEIMIVVTVKC